MSQCERIVMIVLLTGYTVVACAQTTPAETLVSSQSVMIACQEPRPQVCTMQYDPVCGTTSNKKYSTYANACSACSDASVSGHSPGACE
jgi:hypothetical protein